MTYHTGSFHLQVDHLTKFVMGDGVIADADEQAQEERRGNRRDTWAPGVMGAPHAFSCRAYGTMQCRAEALARPDLHIAPAHNSDHVLR